MCMCVCICVRCALDDCQVFKKKNYLVLSQNMDEIKNQVQTLKSVNFVFLNTDDLAPKNSGAFRIFNLSAFIEIREGTLASV